MCAHRGHRPDTKQRMGIMFGSGDVGMNCFNCGFKARWSDGVELSRDFRHFLSVIGVSQADIESLAFDAYFNKDSSKDPYSPSGGGVYSHHKWNAIDLPQETKTIVEWAMEENSTPDFLKVVQYAISRGIDDFSRVAWCPQKDNMLSRRLIVPFTWDGNVVGFSARLATSADNALKYYHQIPQHFVYNLDRQDRNQKYMIVVEGVMDALLSGGVALLHNSCGQEQAQEINMLGIPPIVCPDRDAGGDQLVEDAIRYGWHVSFPPWEHGIKDAGDAVVRYGKLFTIYSILKYATDDPDKIRLWRKMDLEKYGNNRVYA